MRITQGTFSYLPDLTDEEVEAQIRYALGHGWAISVEYTDDPHPRNPYWEMWNLPLFDLAPEHADVAMREVTSCREQFPDQYVKVLAYDSRRGRQTTAMSFIVHRPQDEPGFRLDRTEQCDRRIRYGLHSYATQQQPRGSRYGAGAADS